MEDGGRQCQWVATGEGRRQLEVENGDQRWMTLDGDNSICKYFLPIEIFDFHKDCGNSLDIIFFYENIIFLEMLYQIPYQIWELIPNTPYMILFSSTTDMLGP